MGMSNQWTLTSEKPAGLSPTSLWRQEVSSTQESVEMIHTTTVLLQMWRKRKIYRVFGKDSVLGSAIQSE